MMIKRMRVQNFKALRDVTVDLEPFTVLIGPNDTGKSSFLEGLFAVAESKQSALKHCFWSPWKHHELVYQQQTDTNMTFDLSLNTSSQLEYSLSLRFPQESTCRVVEEKVNGKALGQDHTRTKVNEFRIDPSRQWADSERELLRNVIENINVPTLARWDIEQLGAPSRLPPNRRFPFDPSGYGLATCLAEMKLEDDVRFGAIRDAFCEIFPIFKDIGISREVVRSIERDEFFRKRFGSEGEGYALYLLTSDGVKIPAALASGGILVTLAFLSLTHLREARKLLLIEEPENGLHPSRLKEIIEFLRRAIASQLGAQIVMTTHSPLLLDYVEPQEVRVFLRAEENDIEVFNVADVPDIQERLKYLMLGELVYNEGEQELVKEIRNHAHSDSR